VEEAYTTLQTMFGSLYVSQFPKDSRLYQVILQAEPKYRMTPEDIGQFYVKNRDGEMIPLSALVTTRYVVGPDLVTRFTTTQPSRSTAHRLLSELGPGARGDPRGRGGDMPPGYGFDWAARHRRGVRADLRRRIHIRLIFVFPIFAAQYESWSLPVASDGVPLHWFALRARHPNDIYFQIGLLTLIGLRPRTRS
jgi:multidrug efflux pump